MRTWICIAQGRFCYCYLIRPVDFHENVYRRDHYYCEVVILNTGFLATCPLLGANFSFLHPITAV